ncbi:oligopeptide:H+ symporter [Sphingomonas sp. RT2P30]|uniref:peptide MFS transporter n=1 Tax=Parasphingomonas halimpatiens TaxID=3096162 RepID=UPI002FCADC22
MTPPTFLGHPRGIAFLAFSEAWERFSYYGMQALLVLYMVSELLLPGHIEHVVGLSPLRALLEDGRGPLSGQALASAIFGIFAACVYLTPILGGLLADRLLGRRRTVILGAVLMAVGHFLMAFEQPFLLALVLLMLGAGCFKGNIASQVGGLYAAGDQRRADAFQIFYLCINAGAIMAPLVCGTLGEMVGWSWGFGAAGIGMLIGLGIYLAGQKYYPEEAPRKARHLAVPPMSRRDWQVMALLLAMLPVFSVLLVPNQQVGNAYLLWAKAHVDLHAFGHDLPVTWLLTLESIATIICLPGSVAFWRAWARRRPEPDEMTKIVIGAAFLCAAPALLALGSIQATAVGGEVGIGWLVGFAVLNEVGFANVLPVALALYARAAPRRFAATIIGIYYLQLVGANFLMGLVGGLLGPLGPIRFWSLHVVLAGGSLAALFLIRTVSRALLATQPTPATSMS